MTRGEEYHFNRGNHSDTSSEKTSTPHPVMNYQQYYTNQVGGGQSIYTGRRYQRGHGLGNVLGSLFRTVAPMLRKTAVSLGKDVLRSGVSAGSRALTDIVAGAPVKKSIKRHFVEEGRQLVNKRLKPNKTAPTIKKRTSRRRTVGRKRHRDIFS